ncbi:MAG: hypothetical protein KGL39_18945 [Patescibacteria group bacterium]|nr:hypothetical protein [Patescibacteria group bacterium]
MAPVNLPRTEVSFILPEGTLSFPKLFPGQAETIPQSGNASYKCEWSGQLPVNEQPQASPHPTSIIRAVMYVAQTMDTASPPININGQQYPGWYKHVFGPTGRLRKLEEMGGRDYAKYGYAHGCYVVSLSQIWSPRAVGMENANLSDPTVRAQFDRAVAAKAPRAHRFANPSDPADVARIEQINAENALRGLQVKQPHEYHTVMLPLEPHEIWAGCKVRISGSAYWNPNPVQGSKVGLRFDHILFVRQGERLVGDKSPDDVFASFALSAAMAPQANPQPQFMPPVPMGAAPTRRNPWDELR